MTKHKRLVVFWKGKMSGLSTGRSQLSCVGHKALYSLPGKTGGVGNSCQNVSTLQLAQILSTYWCWNNKRKVGILASGENQFLNEDERKMKVLSTRQHGNMRSVLQRCSEAVRQIGVPLVLDTHLARQLWLLKFHTPSLLVRSQSDICLGRPDISSGKQMLRGS